jgi:hypothetical protein
LLTAAVAELAYAASSNAVGRSKYRILSCNARSFHKVKRKERRENRCQQQSKPAQDVIRTDQEENSRTEPEESLNRMN